MNSDIMIVQISHKERMALANICLVYLLCILISLLSLIVGEYLDTVCFAGLASILYTIRWYLLSLRSI